MNNVNPISKDAITPEFAARSILEDAPKLGEVYCVAFTKDGECFQYHSGDAKGLAWLQR